jgi:hypothetical protein
MRIKVRINGTATGALLTFNLTETTTTAELAMLTANRLGVAATVSPADTPKLYLGEGDEITSVSDIEAGDVVFVAFSGSPFKEKISRTDHLSDCRLALPALLASLDSGFTASPPRAILPPLVSAPNTPLPSLFSFAAASVPPFETPPVASAARQNMAEDRRTGEVGLLSLMASEAEGAESNALDPMQLEREGGPSFVKRLLNLAFVHSSPKTPGAPRAVDTLSCEVSSSFSWRDVVEAPTAEVQQGEYLEVSIQFVHEHHWQVRCYKNSFVNNAIRDCDSKSAEDQLEALFQMGWFRPLTPPTQRLNIRTSSMIVSKPHATRRSPAAVEADWMARVGSVTHAGRVILLAAGPEHGVQYCEDSIRDVFCVVCKTIGKPQP